MFIKTASLSERSLTASNLVETAGPSREILVETFETLAIDLAKIVSRVFAKRPDFLPTIVGTGGDFEQFAEPFINALEKPFGSTVGCLWSHRSPDDDRRGRPIVFFDQEYFEDNTAAAFRSELLIVLQSVITDACPVEQVALAARDLAGAKPILLICGMATKASPNTLRYSLPNAQVRAAFELRPEPIRDSIIGPYPQYLTKGRRSSFPICRTGSSHGWTCLQAND